MKHLGRALLLLWAMSMGLAGCQQPATAPVETAEQAPQRIRVQVVRTVLCQYLLYLPPSYGEGGSDRHWPLMLFLHGAGERGNDLDRVKLHGPPKLIEQGKEFPFIVVSPQCPAGKWWDSQVLGQLLDHLEATLAVDRDRIYVTGLSMGGFGTWNLAARYPHRFAAIVPICGGGNPAEAAKLNDLPIWAFHGEKDSVVPIRQTRDMIKAIEAAGGYPRFTVYPEANHDSWTETYNNVELYAWLLQQHRPAE